MLAVYFFHAKCNLAVPVMFCSVLSPVLPLHAIEKLWREKRFNILVCGNPIYTYKQCKALNTYSLRSLLSEFLESQDAGHHVSGLAGGQVFRLPGGVLKTLSAHHPGLCRGGHWDAEYSASLPGIKLYAQSHSSAVALLILIHNLKPAFWCMSGFFFLFTGGWASKKPEQYFIRHSEDEGVSGRSWNAHGPHVQVRNQKHLV